MRLQDRVVEELKRQFPGKVSNGALARSLDVPEPSIRRLTRVLNATGVILADYTQAAWGTNQGVQYQAQSAA